MLGINILNKNVCIKYIHWTQVSITVTVTITLKNLFKDVFQGEGIVSDWVGLKENGVVPVKARKLSNADRPKATTVKVSKYLICEGCVIISMCEREWPFLFWIYWTTFLRSGVLNIVTVYHIYILEFSATFVRDANIHWRWETVTIAVVVTLIATDSYGNSNIERDRCWQLRWRWQWQLLSVWQGQ